MQCFLNGLSKAEWQQFQQIAAARAGRRSDEDVPAIRGRQKRLRRQPYRDLCSCSPSEMVIWLNEPGSEPLLEACNDILGRFKCRVCAWQSTLKNTPCGKNSISPTGPDENTLMVDG